MKKFLIAALATSMIAGPIVAAAPAAAQARHTETVRYKQNGNVVVKKTTVKRQNVRQPARVTYRSNWRKGERFNRAQARNYRQVSNWRAYQNRRLYAPQRGQQWVQSGNDAILITAATGVIAAVLAGAFN
ncbi:RcnB family protein [Sphingomonas donggukensis]|uniref:RcnB family protein n=1 Tax=Sphingomonas donggukensis TaxID=2949093 RepID=A0ABY4TVU1_9SPHN|nr:RcnB family protein [Sphingomonas donggukensis]URW76432.1 RcnB family protein [Sphingomonas donggukensis]